MLVIPIVIGSILGLGILFIFPFFRKKRKLLRIVEKHKYLYIFVYFLIKNNAYKAYTSNLRHHTIESIYLTYNGLYLISEAFIWDDTNEGFEYWSKLNNSWINSISSLSKELRKELVIKYLKL